MPWQPEYLDIRISKSPDVRKSTAYIYIYCEVLFKVEQRRVITRIDFLVWVTVRICLGTTETPNCSTKPVADQSRVHSPNVNVCRAQKVHNTHPFGRFIKTANSINTTKFMQRWSGEKMKTVLCYNPRQAGCTKHSIGQQPQLSKIIKMYPSTNDQKFQTSVNEMKFLSTPEKAINKCISTTSWQTVNESVHAPWNKTDNAKKIAQWRVHETLQPQACCGVITGFATNSSKSNHKEIDVQPLNTYILFTIVITGKWNKFYERKKGHWNTGRRPNKPTAILLFTNNSLKVCDCKKTWFGGLPTNCQFV